MASSQKHIPSKMASSLLDYVAFVIGGAVYSLSLNAFIAPNAISPGGVTGLAAILNHLFSFPTGITMLTLNIPLLILGVKKIGFKFLTKTIIATVIMSILIDVGSLFIPAYLGNRLLAAVYGGVLSGFGLSLVFLRGGTTGGTDIAAKIINLRFPFISIGRVILILDFVVTVLAALAYRNIETGLYTLITIFVSSKVIDSILYGYDKGRLAFIVSEKPKEIATGILENLGRGVTVLEGKGAYTGSDKDILLCAVRQYEAAKLHSVVKNTDPSSFMIMLEAGEIIGEGFKQI